MYWQMLWENYRAIFSEIFGKTVTSKDFEGDVKYHLYFPNVL